MEKDEIKNISELIENKESDKVREILNNLRTCLPVYILPT